MKQNYFEHIENIVKAGEFLVERCKSEQDDFAKKTILISLIRIEGLLDTGRTLVSPDEYGEGGLKEINKGMDEIRSGIVEIMKDLGRGEVESLLLSLSNSVKTNFFRAIWKD